MPYADATNGHSSLPEIPWPAWLEVDLDAIERNVQVLKAGLSSGAGILAVVKAQAYGLGAARVAEAALRGGAIGLAVARIAEGVQLRRVGLTPPILLLGPIGPGEEDEVVRWRLTATICDPRSADRLADAAGMAGEVAGVHVKVDTGLTRFGARPEELLPLVDRISRLPELRMDGLYSHFASADEVDLSFTHRQLSDFHALRELLASHGHRFAVCHAANSAAVLRCPDSHLDWVRPGITLLGAYPAPTVPRVSDLACAFSLKAYVARVYDLPSGTTVGYGRGYTVQQPTRAALVPAGYADGIPRAHSNRASVLVHGRRAPVIGRVSMDQCVVDVTGITGVRQGDDVVLLGEQEDDAITLDEFAAWSETIPHEVLTRMGPRLPRVYLSGGSVRSAAALDGEHCLDLPLELTVL